MMNTMLEACRCCEGAWCPGLCLDANLLVISIVKHIMTWYHIKHDMIHLLKLPVLQVMLHE